MSETTTPTPDFTPAIGSRWKMNVDWKGRPFPQHGDWTYRVDAIEGDWVKVHITSFGEAGITYASLKVGAWNPDGFISKKGHHVRFVAA